MPHHEKPTQEQINKLFLRPPENVVERNTQLVLDAIADGLKLNPNVSPESASLAGLTVAAQIAYTLSKETQAHAKIMGQIIPEAQKEMEQNAAGMFALCSLLFHISHDLLNENQALNEAAKNDPNSPY